MAPSVPQCAQVVRVSAAQIEDLQVRVAHQDLAIEALNATVAQQDRAIGELREELAQLRRMLRELRPSPLGEDAGHEPPPHY